MSSHGYAHEGYGAEAHGHSHGLVHDSIKRSHEGLRAVVLALVVLALTAGAQAVVFVASGSVALLADLIHNVGDAATAIPLGIAFALRSARAERVAGLFVVLAIFISACVAGYEAIYRLVNPQDVEALWALAAAGAVGVVGNWIAAIIRSRAGRRRARRAPSPPEAWPSRLHPRLRGPAPSPPPRGGRASSARNRRCGS